MVPRWHPNQSTAIVEPYRAIKQLVTFWLRTATALASDHQKSPPKFFPERARACDADHIKLSGINLAVSWLYESHGKSGQVARAGARTERPEGTSDAPRL